MPRGHWRGNQYDGAFSTSTAHTYASGCCAVAATCGSNRVIVGSSEKCSSSPGAGITSLTMPPMDVDHVVAPRTGAAWQVGAGEVVRLIDLEGGQTGDLFLVPTDDVHDGLSNGRTFDYGGTVSLGAASVLYSRRSRPLATVIAD